jgi:hypothetical protein
MPTCLPENPFFVCVAAISFIAVITKYRRQCRSHYESSIVTIYVKPLSQAVAEQLFVSVNVL